MLKKKTDFYSLAGGQAHSYYKIEELAIKFQISNVLANSKQKKPDYRGIL